MTSSCEPSNVTGEKKRAHRVTLYMSTFDDQATSTSKFGRIICSITYCSFHILICKCDGLYVCTGRTKMCFVYIPFSPGVYTGILHVSLCVWNMKHLLRRTRWQKIMCSLLGFPIQHQTTLFPNTKKTSQEVKKQPYRTTEPTIRKFLLNLHMCTVCALYLYDSGHYLKWIK